MQVNGLVLCGGKSTRMGEDKSLINYNGDPQFLYCYNILTKYCDNVYLSCNTSQAERFDSLPYIIDKNEGQGPMEGIRNAFEFDPNVNWLIMPCDMPAIGELEIKKLLDNHSDEFDVSCFQDSSGNIDPLFGIWGNSCNEKLKNYNGDSPKKFLETVRTQLIAITDQIANINYPLK